MQYLSLEIKKNKIHYNSADSGVTIPLLCYTLVTQVAGWFIWV